jgi:hypothetical protein
MSDMKKEPVPFKDAPGLESNQHAKKLAQSAAKKRKTKFESFYSQKGTKVVKVTFKPTGQYQEYVGNLAKTKRGEAQQLKDMIVMWKKEKLWIEPHMLDEVATDKIEKLSK